MSINTPNTSTYTRTRHAHRIAAGFYTALCAAGMALGGAAHAQSADAAVSVDAEARMDAAPAEHKVFTGGGFLGIGGGDVAIKGYDPVAYFTESKAVEGSDAYTAVWQDTTWHFSSEQNAELFKANPEKYAPQYGGFCAYAVAKGDLVKIDPEAWSIVDGKLYLNYSQSVQNKWEDDRAQFISTANAQWPELGKR